MNRAVLRDPMPAARWRWQHWRPSALGTALAFGLVVVFLLNLAIGAVPVSPLEVLMIIARHLGLSESTAITSVQHDAVIWSIRLPRVLLSTLVGSALATAGALLQGLFRNPLADPHVIGVTSGASLAAVAVIVLDLSTLGLWVLPTAAFLGGIVATALTYRLAGTGERLEVVTLVLAGLAINAVAGAGTSLLIFFASDEQLRAVVFWSMGSLSRATWRAVFTALPFVLLGLLLAPRWSRALDLLTLGERDAFYLGVPIARLRWHLIAVAALLTGAAVSVAGTIAFVGLIVPHVIRLAAGPSHRQLLPLSAAGGALTVLLADLVARTVVAPAELPIGVIMGLVGGPFFLWLVRRTRRAHGGWG